MEIQPTVIEGLSQSLNEFPMKDLVEHTHRKEEVFAVAVGGSFRFVRRQASAGLTTYR